MLLEQIRHVAGGEILYLPQGGSLDGLVQTMRQAGTIVISGPCYINTWPARLLELLEMAARMGGFSGQKLYGIINGGMPYVHTHRHGLCCLEFFAERSGLSWQGGFVLGGGAMLDGRPLEMHMNSRKVVPAFAQFVRHIAEGSPTPDSLYEEAELHPGRLLTRFFAWLLSAMVVKRLKQHGHDPDAPNWYLGEHGRRY